MKLLGISVTIVGAKSALLVDAVLEEVKKKDRNIEIDVLDLREYNMQFSDGRVIGKYNKDTQEIINKMLDADFFLIGTPVFNGSIPAPLKNLFDLLPPAALRNKVMGFVAVGGTYQHYLMVENQLKPIAGYLRAYTTPSYVYAHNSHFNTENKIIDEELLGRIESLASELIFMQKSFCREEAKNLESQKPIVNERVEVQVG